jgi:hypothetical protein
MNDNVRPLFNLGLEDFDAATGRLVRAYQVVIGDASLVTQHSEDELVAFAAITEALLEQIDGLTDAEAVPRVDPRSARKRSTYTALMLGVEIGKQIRDGEDKA